MNETFDLAIIGGGPAGTSAAITASRRGHRVLVLERGSFPRHKVCGEFVSFEALQLLHGLCPAGSWKKSPIRVATARIFLDGKMRNAAIKPPADSISRFVMDVALWNAAKNNGVTGLENTAVAGITGHGPFRITAGKKDFVARAVINACGRWSNLSDNMRLPKLDAGIGLKQHFREIDPVPSVDLYFFSGGYCGVQPVGENEINVSAMVSPGVARSLEKVFSLEPNLKVRSNAWTPTMEAVSTYPLVHAKPAPIQPKRNILNVGDAAGFIDPFVGDGISMALHSGCMAADLLSNFLAGECSLSEAAFAYTDGYNEKLLPAFRNAERLRKLIASPSLRGLAMELFRVPVISRLALRSTRARIA